MLARPENYALTCKALVHRAS